jgi:stage II sporulation protein D
LLIGVVTITSCTSCTGSKVDLRPPERVDAQGVPMIRVKLGPTARGAQVATAGDYKLFADGKMVHSGKQLSTTLVYGDGRWTAQGGGLPATLGGKNLVLSVSGTEGLFSYGPLDVAGKPGAAVQYRGDLHLLPQSSDTFFAVNQVDMESYVAGVLPKELYASWHHETYRALGVAARTFAYFHRQQSAARGRLYDVGDGESSQVYGGYTAERSVSHARQAVESTRGKVLTWNGVVIMSQYSSCCGGRTNPASVLRGDAPADGPFVGGAVCRDCVASTRFNWPTVVIDKASLLTALRARYSAANSLSGITEIRVKTQTDWGRAILIEIVGPGGSITIRADDLRLAWNFYNGGPSKPGFLFSMNCQWQVDAQSVTFYNGQGFGHGVGLCQFGAQGKALKGWSGEQILGAYYSGAKLTTLWK